MTPAESEQLLDNLYNAFNPAQPLEADDPVYVDCREVRGEEDILTLGRRIKRSKDNTCFLYAGHRGAGKSTELKKLQQFLEDERFFVVYFAADEEDIDAEDTEYTDILLACTKHLLKVLEANRQPLVNWLKSCWADLKDVMTSEITVDKITAEVALREFGKLTADIRAVPTQRYEIRRKVTPHTVTLINALNEFIEAGKKQRKQEIVVIVDNLDRIPAVYKEDSQRTIHDEIFLDRCEQLKALACHVIYTVPISMVYSGRATDIRDIYTEPQTLPMLKVHNQDNSPDPVGISKMQEVIVKRVGKFTQDLDIATQIFDDEATFNGICRMSGGHMRNLMLLMQSAIQETEMLPITRRAVLLAIGDARDTYRRTVQSGQWELLVRVYQDKKILNDETHRQLLFNRCILEYVNLETGSMDFDAPVGRQNWYDVHPLILGIPQFQEALQALEAQNE
jgi:energy-coupling factor transporter ATP-binding protein EcfA2